MARKKHKNVLAVDPAAEKSRWLQVLDDLVTKVEGWAKELGWSTRRIEKRVSDTEIGDYVAPVLLMQEETTRVLLEPISRALVGAEGAVDLYLMPAYDDIARLFLVDGAWVIYPFDVLWYPADLKSGADDEYQPRPLSKESICEVLTAMKSHAG